MTAANWLADHGILAPALAVSDTLLRVSAMLEDAGGLPPEVAEYRKALDLIIAISEEHRAILKGRLLPRAQLAQPDWSRTWKTTP